MASLAACLSAPESNQQFTLSVAPGFLRLPSLFCGAIKDDATTKDGDVMKNDAMRGNAIDKEGDAMNKEGNAIDKEGDAIDKEGNAMTKTTTQ